MKSLDFTEQASNDIASIRDFYGSSSSAWNRIGESLERAFLHLIHNPYTGHRRSDLTSLDLCFWTARNFLIVFKVLEDQLVVIAVLHAARNISAVLRERDPETN